MEFCFFFEQNKPRTQTHTLTIHRTRTHTQFVRTNLCWDAARRGGGCGGGPEPSAAAAATLVTDAAAATATGALVLAMLPLLLLLWWPTAFTLAVDDAAAITAGFFDRGSGMMRSSDRASSRCALLFFGWYVGDVPY